MTKQEAAEMIRNDMKIHHDYLSGQYRKALNMAIDALLKKQTEIVRCKDCKYCSSEIKDGIKFAKCELEHNWMPQPEWFCADGEKR